MPREETEIGPIDEPRGEFVQKLRALRDDAGRTAPQIAESTKYSPRSIYAAFNSNSRPPSWPMTAAIIRDCGGNPDELRDLHKKARADYSRWEAEKRRAEAPDPHPVPVVDEIDDEDEIDDGGPISDVPVVEVVEAAPVVLAPSAPASIAPDQSRPDDLSSQDGEGPEPDLPSRFYRAHPTWVRPLVAGAVLVVLGLGATSAAVMATSATQQPPATSPIAPAPAPSSPALPAAALPAPTPVPSVQPSDAPSPASAPPSSAAKKSGNAGTGDTGTGDSGGTGFDFGNNGAGSGDNGSGSGDGGDNGTASTGSNDGNGFDFGNNGTGSGDGGSSQSTETGFPFN